MQKLKTQNGITLIALVITIIVMMILVGVSVTVALNGGIFSTAKQAAEGTAAKRDEELNLSSGQVEINGESYNSIDEYVSGGSSNESTGYEAYSIGDEVTVGGENFYVIADSDETESTVTLLAKYNLNKAGTAQSNATYTETACAFSNTNYWSSETTYPLNLNEYTIPEGETSVITTAKTYGEAKGGIGRLMTDEEADALTPDYAGIIYGTSIDATDGYLYYWLGSASDNLAVYYVYGDFQWIVYQKPDVADDCGVRPVIEISKSSIS